MLKQFFKSKNKLQTPSIGSNSQIVSQLHALEIEKDILTKTIARLYQNETDLTKIQKDSDATNSAQMVLKQIVMFEEKVMLEQKIVGVKK